MIKWHYLGHVCISYLDSNKYNFILNGIYIIFISHILYKMKFDNHISFKIKLNKSSKHKINHISSQMKYSQLNITIIISHLKLLVNNNHIMFQM